jgi:hypothetical protein
VARLRPTRAPLGRCSSQFSLLPAQRTDRRSRCGSRRQVRCAHGAGFDVDLDLADLHAEWKSLRSRNARLYAAALKMPDELYRRATGVFFKSLHGTLNRPGSFALPLRCWHEDAGAKFHHQFWAAASVARSVLRLVLELDGQVVERADPHIGLRRCVEGLVFLPFVDCARKLLKTRLNVTHHQAPIFALTLSSLLVDSPAEPFKCSSQSVDFILKIIVDFPLG